MLVKNRRLSKRGVEVWLSIPGYKNKYEVSNLGRVRSLPRWVGRNYRQWTEGRILKASETDDGYYRVLLFKDGKWKNFGVHQLVLKTFDRSRPPGKQSRYINGNSRDNKLCNLRWGTPRRNNQDRIDHGTVARGEKNGGGQRLTEKQVIQIFKASGFQRPIARRYGVSQRLVSMIKRKEIWKHVTATL